MAVDTKKLEQFLGQFVTDLGATVHAGMVVIPRVGSAFMGRARGWFTHASRIGCDQPHRRTLCARVAVFSGRWRLRHVQPAN